MSRKILLVFTALLTITLAGFSAGCLAADTTADQGFDGSDQVALQDSDTTGLLDSDTVGLEDDDTLAMQDEDAGIEPEAVNPNAPAAPTLVPGYGIDANAVDYIIIYIFWTDNSSNEAGFKLYAQKWPGGDWVLKDIVLPNSAGGLARLKHGKTYCFKAVAYNSYGKSTSNILCQLIP